MHEAIQACLPKGRDIFFLVEGDKLELQPVANERTSVQINGPLVVVVLDHRNCPLGIPCTQRIVATKNSQTFNRTQLWGTNHETHHRLATPPCGMSSWTLLTTIDALRESRTIKIGILGNVNPMVVHIDVSTASGSQLQPMGLCEPLVAFLRAIGLHTVEIVDDASVGDLGRCIYLACPMFAVMGAHSHLCWHDATFAPPRIA